MELLIEQGATLDLPEEDGGTGLHNAARMGHLNIVEVLVDHGASVDLQNQAGNTPMMIAASRGHVNVVRWLIEKGANIRHKNKDGNTALSAAMEFGHHGVVEVLADLETGDLSTVSVNEGAPTMSEAPDFGMYVASNLLDDIGAPDYSNKDGHRGVSGASEFGNRNVVELLEDIGSPAVSIKGGEIGAAGVRDDEGPSSMEQSGEAFGVEFIPQSEPTISSADATIVNLPGGGWDGFWKHPLEDGRMRVVDTWVRIRFQDGAMVGVGDDEVGDYVIEGTYDSEEQTCHWTKKYVDPQTIKLHEGRFVMISRGFQKGHIAMEGTWRTGEDIAGTFKLVSRQRREQ